MRSSRMEMKFRWSFLVHWQVSRNKKMLHTIICKLCLRISKEDKTSLYKYLLQKSYFWPNHRRCKNQLCHQNLSSWRNPWTVCWIFLAKWDGTGVFVLCFHF
jgi:hypothetical protein